MTFAEQVKKTEQVHIVTPRQKKRLNDALEIWTILPWGDPGPTQWPVCRHCDIYVAFGVRESSDAGPYWHFSSPQLIAGDEMMRALPSKASSNESRRRESWRDDGDKLNGWCSALYVPEMLRRTHRHGDAKPEPYPSRSLTFAGRVGAAERSLCLASQYSSSCPIGGSA